MPGSAAVRCQKQMFFGEFSVGACDPEGRESHMHVFLLFFTGNCAKVSTFQCLAIEKYEWHPYLTPSQVVP
jgi:hypothetical protein